MRKALIAGNWKMNKTINESVRLAIAIKKTLDNFAEADIIICPPFTALSAVYEGIKDTTIQLGAQNLFWEKSGAFTGEISPVMVKDAGCEYVIIGHSERRKYFLETDELVNKKIKVALEIGLMPIVCVGETLEEREAGQTIEIVKKQLEGGFAGISVPDMMQVVIAYEPVWAIGTGRNATPGQAEEVHAFIRTWVKGYSGEGVARDIRILYGGSVNPANIKELMQQEDVDGALVGGASLEAASFEQIVKNAVEK